MTKTIGIVSIKGGVGKTSVTTALGSVMAKDFGKKVLVVDANFSAPNLGLHLGIVDPDATIHQVMEGKIDAKDAIYETEHSMHVLPGALLNKGKIDPLKLSEKLRNIRRNYDVILIDSSPNLNNEFNAAMLASDELLMVTTPDQVTLSTTLRAIKAANEKRVPIIGLVLNKVYDKYFETNMKEIENASGASVLAVIPHEVSIPEALSYSAPSTVNANEESTREFKKLAACLIGENYQEKGFKNFFRKIFGKISQQDINRDIFRRERVSNPFFK